jgi:hypothetical protein
MSLPESFKSKMAAKGCSPAAMGAFERNYMLLTSGAATTVTPPLPRPLLCVRDKKPDTADAREFCVEAGARG